jgi:hypothetical protein
MLPTLEMILRYITQDKVYVSTLEMILRYIT